MAKTKRVQVIVPEEMGARLNRLILLESARQERILTVSEYLRGIIEDHINNHTPHDDRAGKAGSREGA